MPFLVVGPGVKANYAGAVSYTHSSLVKSVERILGLPILSTVSCTTLGSSRKPGGTAGGVI